ncbi:DNA-3-methyladenine glycosylase 2 family protein [Aestuariimicrobium ganziense]|uniref:DNA-3-methyladenine glycosylase 2 family protein n=1 Tax=Aestuariimicrobium ganziense TaxID=2773677 RepID=UPI0019431AD5|nr:AlkA N-terminal domain-containing protein [Aestuariimicrobium ganziense]
MTTALPDHDSCYRAVSGRDRRFDGWIYVGVTSTGIYCRPSCPAVTPKPQNCRFYATAGAAQEAGFRACRRCRPDAVPGSPLWRVGDDVTARAMRLIGDGVVDREGVAGLARRLGYSSRQLHRLMVDHAGASPLALARAQRAHAARILLEGTGLAITDVAFAAGFGSVRQFNETIREVFARTPRQVRQSAHPVDRASAGQVSVRLPTRAPFAVEPLLDHFARRTAGGVESSHCDGLARSVRMEHGPGVVVVRRDGEGLRADLALTDWRDLAPLLARLRRMLDLDADSRAIDAALAADPRLARSVAARPGVRLPGALDAADQAVRTIIGQQISVTRANQIWHDLAERHGEPLPPALGEVAAAAGHRLTLLPPSASALAAIDPETLPMPRARGRAVVGLAAAIAAGEIDLGAGADRDEARARLEALPGIGGWTSGYIAMRALNHPDVDLTRSDLVVRRSAGLLGISDAAPFAPWRSYLCQHLWLHATPAPEAEETR